MSSGFSQRGAEEASKSGRWGRVCAVDLRSCTSSSVRGTPPGWARGLKKRGGNSTNRNCIFLPKGKWAELQKQPWARKAAGVRACPDAVTRSTRQAQPSLPGRSPSPCSPAMMGAYRTRERSHHGTNHLSGRRAQGVTLHPAQPPSPRGWVTRASPAPWPPESHAHSRPPQEGPDTGGAQAQGLS